jgi:energy-coupling factor transporter ATP-binding protein EcfA2
MFPENHFGQYVLTRDRVVKNIKEEIAIQLSLGLGGSQSVYLSGCRGSGKTSLLNLLARAFKAEDYEVYFFLSAVDIPQDAYLAFMTLLEDKTKKVAVLIDEVASNPVSGLFTALLKGPYPHLVTIGAAVPRFIPGHAARFNCVLRMTDLVLREEDEDFQKLTKYCEGLQVTTPEMTQMICKYLLKQCGGHAFPTLAFIEHCFCGGVSKDTLSTLENFHRYFFGPDFIQSQFYLSVRGRCFDQLLDKDTEMVAFRVLGGKEEAGDITTLTRLGWWNSDSNDFISQFLVNACLSGVKSGINEGVFYLDEKKTPEENTEMVIIEGLRGMDDSDFKCWQHKSEIKVENGVSFNWAHQVRLKIPNAYLQFQERDVSGRVDFYLNGFADTAIEVMLNATKTTDVESKHKQTRQSRDIDGHVERFRDGKCGWKRYVLFNFAMTKEDKVVLPKDASAHDKVYTYVHSTNTLYRGAKLIKSSAIPKLSGGSRPFNDGQTRSFSTMLRANRPRDVKCLSLSVLKHLIVFIRG